MLIPKWDGKLSADENTDASNVLKVMDTENVRVIIIGIRSGEG